MRSVLSLFARLLTRPVRPRRSPPALRCEPLEDRLAPAATSLYVVTQAATTTGSLLKEYTLGGSLVRTVAIPDTGVAEYARDLAVTGDLVRVYNGTFTPELSTYDGNYTGTTNWSSDPGPPGFGGWSTVNNVSYGGLAVFGSYAFATDMSTADGPEAGIVRLYLEDGYRERFATDFQPIDVNTGLDGLLYALDANRTVRVYHPETLALVRTVTLPASVSGNNGGTIAQDYRAIAADGTGRIYAADWGRTVTRFSPTGAAELSTVLPGTSQQGPAVGNLTDIDFVTPVYPNDGGTLAVGSSNGVVAQLGSLYLTQRSAFQVGTGATFVTAGAALVEAAVTGPGAPVAEGDSGSTAVPFTVTLSRPSAQSVNLTWTLQSGTATAGSDFSSASGTATFAPGETQKTFHVQVLGDTADELDESFTVYLSAAVGTVAGAVVTNPSAVFTIRDDDAAATATAAPAVAAGNAFDSQGDGTFDSFSATTGALEPRHDAGTYEKRAVIEFDTLGVDLAASPTVTLDVYVEFPWYLSTTARVYGYAGDGAAALADAAQTGTLLGTLGNLSGSSVATGWRRVTLDRAALAGLMAQGRYVGIVLDADAPTSFSVRGTGDPLGPRLNFWNGAPPALPSIDIYGGSNYEGNPGGPAKTITYQVYLSQATTVPVTVDYATRNDQPGVVPGVDYVATSGTLTFAPGETYKPVTVALIGDTAFEPTEYLYLQLSNPTLASFHTLAASGTILNDDAAPLLSATPVGVTEPDAGTTNAVFTVTLSNASYQTVTVNYSTIPGTATAGTDYTAVSGALTFAPGETTKTVSVPVRGDFVYEPDETFQLSLSGLTNASYASSSTFTATIANNDPVPTVTVARYTAGESGGEGGALGFRFTLSNPSAAWVYVDYATADLTATAGADYVAKSGTLIFTTGEVQKDIFVQLLQDTTDEPDETFAFNLSNPQQGVLGTTSVPATIRDDDLPPAVSAGSPSVTEGNAGSTTLTFALTLSNPSAQPVSVDYATADGTATAGTDYGPVSGALTFAPGETSRIVSVTVFGDVTNEASETLSLVLSNPTNASLGTATGTGTITNDDTAPTVAVDSPYVFEGDGGTTELTFVLTLSNPSDQPITVTYGTADGTATASADYTAADGSVTFAPGETTKSVTVLVTGDRTFEADETLRLNVTSGGATTTGTGTVRTDDPRPTVGASSASLLEGGFGDDPLMVFTVSLSNPSDQPISVEYRTADGTASVADADYHSATGTLTFGAGETTRTVAVRLRSDTKYEPDETFALELTYATNATVGAGGTGTIRNDDGVPAVRVSTGSLYEGNTGTRDMVFVVSLTNPTVETVTVSYATQDGTAAAGTDYLAAAGTLTFLPGETAKQVLVTVNGDTLFEGTEQFAFALSNPTNATLGDTQAAGIIGDDDFPTVTATGATAAEGDAGTTALTFTLALSNPSVEAVTVNYATATGTATAGTDFTAASGSVTFAPGQTAKTVTVLVRGDTDLEADETLRLNLSLPNGTNAALGTEFVTGTIVNDDFAPVANAGPDRTANEGAAVAFNGSGSSDADGDPLTYSWSFGDGTTATGVSPTHTYADSGTYTVTLTVSDGRGGTSSDTAVVTVRNVAPTAGVTGPTTGVRGQSRTFTLTATDPSTVDQTSAFRYRIEWGDGTTETVTGPGAGTAVAHTYTATGTFQVRVWATDKDGLEGAVASRTYTATAAAVQGTDLVIGGTTGADAIVVTATATANAVQVSVNGANLGTFTATGQLVVLGQSGDDAVSFATTRVRGTTYSVAQPLLLFGGSGNDTLDARNATGPAVLVGGAGNDTLYGGTGRALLLGGLGADVLRGGSADDILIGGITDYDDDLVALAALRAEWARTSADYATRRDRLLAGVGGYALDAARTHDDGGAVDNLFGNGGRDWFFVAPTDRTNDRQSNETLTGL